MAIPHHRTPEDGFRTSQVTQIESSNSTMAQFLGARQKTWMMGAYHDKSHPMSIAAEKHLKSPSTLDAQPKKKRGRPSRAELALRVARAPAAAREEVCILAQPPNRSREGANGSLCHQANSRGSQQERSEQHDPSNPMSRFLANPPTGQNTTSKEPATYTDPVLPSPAPSAEAHKGNSNIIELEDGGTEEEDTVQRVENQRLADLAARFGGIEELEKRLESTSETMNVSRPDISELNTGAAQHYDGNSSYRKRNGTLTIVTPSAKRTSANCSSSQQRAQSSSVRNSTVMAHSVSPSHHSTFMGPPNDSRLDDSLSRYLNSLIPKIDSRLEMVRAAKGSRGMLEESRLQLLRDACEGGDLFYLLIHEIFCYCFANPISSLPGLTDKHVRGMVIVSELIMPNTGLLHDAVRWFSTFPSPINTLIFAAPIYQVTFQAVLECISLLDQNWQQFKDQCFSRKVPPLADFMERDLGVMSRIFQRVIYTAVHRGFWVGHYDECFQKCSRLFLSNQETSQQWQARQASAGSPTKEEMTMYYQNLIADYTRIHEQHLPHSQLEAQNNIQRLQAQSSPINSPMGPPSQIQGVRPSMPATSKLRTPGAHTASFPVRVTVLGRRASGDLTTNTRVVQAQQDDTYNRPSNTPYFSPTVASMNPAIISGHPGHSNPAVPSSHSINAFDSSHWSGGQSSSTVGVRSTTQQGVRSLPVQTDLFRHSTGRHPQRTSSLPCSTEQPLWAPSTQNNRADDPSDGLETLPAGASVNSWQVQSGVYRRGYPIGSGTQVRSQSTSGLRNQLAHTQLLPPSGYSMPILQQPNPAASALHQAYVRDPTLVTEGIPGKPSDSGGTSSYFQTVNSFAINPFTMPPQSRTVIKDFHISTQMFESLPQDESKEYGTSTARRVNTGSHLYRLRCIDVTHAKEISESQWVIGETAWPSAVAVILNGISLEIRRKPHHGKDLPIDITSHVKEGVNHLQVSVLRVPQAGDVKSHYSLAVEVIEINDYKKAREAVKDIDAAKAQEQMKKQLANNNPDVEVINSDIVIDVVDPFSSRLIETPVRSTTCRHHECFDLDIFLQTRQGSPCKPEQFRCPICGADARPQCLRRDGWFVSVLKELRDMKRFNARAIVVDEQAAWRIREEEKEGESGDGTGRRKSTAQSSAAPGGGVEQAPVRREIEVIELE
ncbi:hypothetical protein MMC24_004988 [Lignoscripta atroalba]|nr:hypothetical protein [Lignoscripta atroalba]